MAYTEVPITNGPGQRDLEVAFLSRNLGGEAQFTVLVPDYGSLVLGFKIYNFSFVTNQGQKYKLGGRLPHIGAGERGQLPQGHFVLVEYDAETRQGRMEFSNGE